jgi:hypothetical protein
MTLTPTPLRPCARRTGLKFSSQAVALADAATFSADAPSAKLTININAFNGNKTNFGKK